MGSVAHMAGNSIRVETQLAAWWILSIDMYCLFTQCFWKIESKFKDWKISRSSPEYLACHEIGCMWPVSAHSRRGAGAGQWLSHSSWPWCPQTKQNKTWTCALEPTSFTLVNSLPSYRGHWSLWPLPGFPDFARGLHNDCCGRDGVEGFLLLFKLTAWGFHDRDGLG